MGVCVHAEDQCEGGQCTEGDKPTKAPTPGVKKNKYQKPGAKKNKYQKPGAKKNKYQRPGAKKNKYQRKNKYQKAAAGGNELGDYSFEDPTANHMQMGIQFDEQKKPDLSIKAFEAAVKFQGTPGDYMNLGVALMRSASFHSRNPDYYDRAEEVLKKAKELEPENSNIDENLKALHHSMTVDDIYAARKSQRSDLGEPKKKKYQRPKKKKKYQ
jgi:tetratricopeptide (TPR) repeat protein